MDNKQIKAWNAISVAIAVIAAILFWLLAPEQIIGAVALAVFLITLALLVNTRKKWPWQGLTTDEVVLLVIAVIFIGFAWFYMPVQLAWAFFDVALLLLLGELYLLWRKPR